MQIDRLGSLALLVRLDLIAHALPFVQGVQAGALDRGDMHENIASAAVWFYKAITLSALKNLTVPRCGMERIPSNRFCLIR